MITMRGQRGLGQTLNLLNAYPMDSDPPFAYPLAVIISIPCVVLDLDS